MPALESQLQAARYTCTLNAAADDRHRIAEEAAVL